MKKLEKITGQCLAMLLACLHLFLPAGCGKDEEKTVETTEQSTNNPPPETDDARYDTPENPGFSPDQPIGHCMVLAGYDKDSDQIFLSDPADNLKTGHKKRASFEGHPVRFVKNYLTTW